MHVKWILVDCMCTNTHYKRAGVIRTHVKKTIYICVQFMSVIVEFGIENTHHLRYAMLLDYVRYRAHPQLYQFLLSKCDTIDKSLRSRASVDIRPTLGHCPPPSVHHAGQTPMIDSQSTVS